MSVKKMVAVTNMNLLITFNMIMNIFVQISVNIVSATCKVRANFALKVNFFQNKTKIQKSQWYILNFSVFSCSSWYSPIIKLFIGM